MLTFPEPENLSGKSLHHLERLHLAVNAWFGPDERYARLHDAMLRLVQGADVPGDSAPAGDEAAEMMAARNRQLEAENRELKRQLQELSATFEVESKGQL